ncbi:PQQ-like beta-propeller repeat protein [bacterium]|nr:PQQ-like beta-propeller repeat protein [bacterium]
MKKYLATALFTLLASFAWNADWPQYRGINRDGISKETAIAKTWPEAGPKVVWKTAVGDGYSGMAIVGTRIYTMDAKDKDEFVVCIDATSGKEIWRQKQDANFINDQGNGPRGTPTVEGNVVYSFGAQGMLSALNTKDGSKIWAHDVKKEVGGKVPIWGFSSSPLIDGELLILPVGGSENNAIVAFNKKTGAVAWRSQGDEPGYSSAIAVNIKGVRQIVAFSGTKLLSVSPADGKLLWAYPWKTDWFVNAAVPIFMPEDKIFISTAYDHGAALLKVNVAGGKSSVQEVWLGKSMRNHFNTSILHNGYIYGFDNAVLKCIDANTGEEKWKRSGYGKGSLILADGHLLVLSERGQLVMVEATPTEYKEKASAEVLQGKCWTMPTLVNGKLFVRNQKEMVCLDLKG